MEPCVLSISEEGSSGRWTAEDPGGAWPGSIPTMYRHCLVCSGDLGDNQVVEAFPVGRRLAFDPEKGRLWVICRGCERWNLTPIEERWEALEDLERLFRETPLRASSEQIGLARHREGLEMVRVGRPVLPEFAAWRYGDQFNRRRRRHIRNSVVGVGVVGGLAAGSVGVVGGMLAFQLGVNALNVVNLVRLTAAPTVRLSLEEGEALALRPVEVGGVKLRPGPGDGGRDESADWHLVLEHEDGKRILTGRDAVRALRTCLPRINRAGASGKDVKTAVRELEDAGSPEAFFASTEQRARKQGWGFMTLGGLPSPLRLALEMAAHEDVERIALEGELAWLETQWKEAEELAAISDGLTLPDKVRVRLEELKARRGSRRRDEGPDRG